MGGINSNAKLPLPDFARKPEQFASTHMAAGMATGTAAGALTGSVIYLSKDATPNLPDALKAALMGGTAGAVGALGLANRLNRRNIPMAVTENGKETTVFVSSHQWNVIQKGLQEGYKYDGLAHPDQFKGAIPKPVTH